MNIFGLIKFWLIILYEEFVSTLWLYFALDNTGFSLSSAPHTGYLECDGSAKGDITALGIREDTVALLNVVEHRKFHGHLFNVVYESIFAAFVQHTEVAGQGSVFQLNEHEALAIILILRHYSNIRFSWSKSNITIQHCRILGKLVI